MHQPIGARWGPHRSRPRPTTVQCAEVQSTVDSRLHAADAARLERPPRSVQPQVDAPRERPVHRHVEVLNEDDPVLEMSLVPELDDLAQQFLSELVAGCALPPKMIWTGRSGSPRMRARRSGSRRNSVGRLYATKRPTKPMVSASASQDCIGGARCVCGAATGELLVAADPGELDEPGARPAPRIPQPFSSVPSSSFHESGDPGVVFQSGRAGGREALDLGRVHDLNGCRCDMSVGTRSKATSAKPPHWLRVTARQPAHSVASARQRRRAPSGRRVGRVIGPVAAQ